MKGHSKNWALCPKRVASEKNAANVMNIHTALPPSAASSGSSSQTPSIHSVADTMTVSERALHGYNEKLLNILNVLATNTRSAGTMSAGNPLLDPAAMLQAFQTNPFGHCMMPRGGRSHRFPTRTSPNIYGEL